MTETTDLDGRLVAYADGELDDAAAREVEDELARNPAAAAVVAAHRETAALLKAAYPESRYAGASLPPLPLAAPRPATPRPAGRTRARRYGWAIAASLLLGVIGYGAGTLWPPGSGADNRSLLAEIAEYHDVYSRETRHLVEADASQADHIKQWLGARVHRAIVIPDLTADGLTFAGARMVPLDGKPAAVLMYTRKDGLPIAVCVVDLKTGPETVVEQHAGTSVAAWGRDGHMFIVVGEGPTRLIKDIAGAVQQQI